MTSRIDRLPPHDKEAEEAVLGSVLVDEEAWAAVCGIVRPQDFFSTKHGPIFQACIDLTADGTSLNQITVGHQLARKDELEGVGGVAYLSKLVTELPTPVGVEYYAQIVRRDAIRRAVIERAMRISQVAYRGDGQLEALFDDFQSASEELRVEASGLLGVDGGLEVLEGAAFAEPVGDAPHVIGGIAPQFGFTAFVGMGETYKSWLAADAAVCVAAGIPWLARFPGLQGPTMIFDQEMDEPEVKRRLQRLATGHHLELENLPIAAVVQQDLNISDPSDMGRVIDTMKRRGVVLAVFDAAADFFADMKLNDDHEVREAIRRYQRIGRETGAGIIGVHHFRKTSKESVNDPKERIFGSVYWYNKSDAAFAFQLAGPERVMAIHAKARKGLRLDPFVITSDGDMDDDFIRLCFAGEVDETLDKQSMTQGWLLRTLAERGVTKRPDLLAAAATAKVAAKRTVENALGTLIGGGLIEKASRPGEAHAPVYYWLEGQAPAWTATEEMI